MAVTVEDLRARTDTDLDDPTLQRILDAAVEAVNRAAGSPTEETEAQLARNSDWTSVLRPVSSITSIVERQRSSSDPVTLAADDYRLVGKYRIFRFTDGTNPARCWGDELLITYVPEADTATRDRVALDLSALSIEFRAYEREKSGDWDGEQKLWRQRHRALLAQVREGRSPIV